MGIYCAACRSPDIIQDSERGEVCCVRCGMVLEDRIPGADAEPAGVVLHTPIGIPETSIGSSPDAGGTARRLRRTDGRVAQGWTPAALRSGGLTAMRAMHDKLSLPESVYARAAAVFAGAVSAGHTRGRIVTAMAAASLYLACREAGVPRTIPDMAGASGLSRKTVGRHVRALLELGGAGSPEQYGIPILTARLAAAVGAGTACAREAAGAAGGLDRTFLDGRRPMVVAAAVLHVTMQRMSELRNMTKALRRVAGSAANAAGAAPANMARHGTA